MANYMQSTMSLLAKPHCSAKTKRLLLSSSSRRIVVALLVVCSICLGSPMTLAFHVPIGMNVNNNKRVAVGGPSSDDTFQSCRHYFPSLHINNKNRDLLLRGRALFLATDLFFATIEDSINTQGLDEQLIDEQEGDDDDDPSIGTIQILMSDTGGGHRASANALRDAFNFLYPPDNQSSTNGGSSPGKRIACDIVDIYTEYGPVWPYNDYVALYKFMAAYPWIWQAFYEFGSTDFGLWLNDILLEFFCFDAFAACLNRPSAAAAASTAESLSSKRQRRQRADMVVSVHPLTQELPLKILATLDHPSNDYSFKQRMPKTSRQTPFCTVVTDLGSAHPTWFNPGVDLCFVPSDALNLAAQSRGLLPSQIKQYGLPIRKGFWSGEGVDNGSLNRNADKKRALREKLGLDGNLPVVLVVGGGDGMGGLVDISKALGQALGRSDTKGTAKSESKSQMVVVCGKNQQAKDQLDQFETEWGDNVSVQVQGFVDNMDEWMKAADVLVTKAGPGTIAEASICGLPCMMFSFLPGQEEGNIPFVEEAGFGKFSGNPNEIATIVSSWLSSPDELAMMQTAALTAARPQATLDIARDIAEYVFRYKESKTKRNT